MAFFNAVFREMLADPFMVAPSPMVAQQQAQASRMHQMARMMDTMMMPEPVQMREMRISMARPGGNFSAQCPVHSPKPRLIRNNSEPKLKPQKVEKPISWTIKPKTPNNVPRQRAGSICEGNWKNSLRQGRNNNNNNNIKPLPIPEREKLLPAIPNPSARRRRSQSERREQTERRERDRRAFRCLSPDPDRPGAAQKKAKSRRFKYYARECCDKKLDESRCSTGSSTDLAVSRDETGHDKKPVKRRDDW